LAQVVGNFHFSPGRSFQASQAQVQELVPYLKDNNHHDFGHVIKKFQFEAEGDAGKGELTRKLRKKLGIVNPLDGLVVHPEECECALGYWWRAAE
jgi:hypothetical protein